VTYDFRQVKDEEEELDTPAGTLTPLDSDTDLNPKILKTKEFLQQKLFENEDKPLNITPATIETNNLVINHHGSNPPLTSLYAHGLKLCQPDNAINAFGEPPFTNWAHGYKETLDYIFVVGDSVDKVQLTGLLSMPRREQMGEGEPQEGRFPSDHVSEMVEVELL
jgi:mRNA deadenylase 3'-5' endonuclease subunit Ccr4